MVGVSGFRGLYKGLGVALGRGRSGVGLVGSLVPLRDTPNTELKTSDPEPRTQCSLA